MPRRGVARVAVSRDDAVVDASTTEAPRDCPTDRDVHHRGADLHISARARARVTSRATF